jgi:hypothetical protein
MQFGITVALALGGLLLDVLVIAAVLRSRASRYAFLLLCVIGDLLTTVVEIRPQFAYENASAAEKIMFANLYWWDERIMQVLTFTLVISLIYLATSKLRPRRILFLGVVCGTAAFVGLTFLIEFSSRIATWKWMTYWTRDLNFGSAILDLGLWAVLIGATKKDYRLLIISGALGLRFTGGAIGQALRSMSPDWQLAGADFIGLANLACLYLWWQAFAAPKGKPGIAVKVPKETSDEV